MKRWLFLLALLIVPRGIAFPVERTERLADEQLRSAIFVETLAMPTPGEFFTAFDKEAQPNWARFLKTSDPVASADREHISLQLGIHLANGYIAIEAEDGQALKNTARDILALTKKLNVAKYIVARSQSLGDFAGAADWNTLREELDATQNDVRLALLEQKDGALVVFSMAGSWIRQIDVATNLLLENYKPAPAALLDQPTIASHLINRLDGLPEKTTTRPLVKKLRDALESARTLMAQAGSGPLPEPAVREIAATMSDLVAAAAEPCPKPTPKP
jgi:hypothetical protein